LNALVIFTCIGYLTAVIQKFTVLKLKDNVKLSVSQIILEILIVAVSGVFIVMNAGDPKNDLVSNSCSGLIAVSPIQSKAMSYGFALISQSNSISFQLVLSAIVVL